MTKENETTPRSEPRFSRQHCVSILIAILFGLLLADVGTAQMATVTFDEPVPPGTSGDLLNGVFEGIDFGTGEWRWEGPFGPNSTNHIFFDSGVGTNRSFQFAPGPRVLESIQVFVSVAGTLTLSDDQGQSVSQGVTPGSLQVIQTGWTQAATTVTVDFTAGWELGVDDIISLTPNPVPAITDIDPAAAAAGGPAFTLTVTGSGFMNGSMVRWNGTDRRTTFISATQLAADITAADVAIEGPIAVTVFTPTPGGGASNVQGFVIVEPDDLFFDDFNRPDSATLGNGWIEKNPAAFALAGTEVNKAATVTGFADNLAYRPVSESMLDGEASVEVRLNSLPPGFAQVFVRGQTATIGNAGMFDGYLLFIDGDPGRVLLDRVENGAFVPLATLNLNPGLNTIDTFRLRLRATGTDPVVLEATVERFNGTTWEVIGQAVVNDTASTRFTTPGTVGFTGFTEGEVYTFDNFTRTNFDGAILDPIPAITAINPGSAPAGANGFTLTVTGSNFVEDSVVRWDGMDQPTTFVSTTELQAAIPATDIETAGIAAVTVVTPALGVTSTPHSFFIQAPGSNFFFDDFNGPNNPNIGNGWTEKFPAAFALQNNEVVSIDTTPIDYHDTIVYRPLSEDRRDVEVSVEFRVLAGQNFPQVHARVQRDTISQADTLEDYMLFVDGAEPSPGRAIIAYQRPVPGEFECYMLAIPFPSPLQQTERYRLRFQVTGTDPVELTGIVERLDGGTWQDFASGTILHDATTQRDPNLFCDPGFLPPPITNAGAIGFAKWITNNEVLDNFFWVDLPVTVTFDAPVPPGVSGALLTGVFEGIDFGPGQWRWEGAFGPNPTNHIFFDSGVGTARTFQFTPGPRIFESLRVFTGMTGTLTLSDDQGQSVSQVVTPGSLQVIRTGWAQASTTVTVGFTTGWELGVDDITFRE